VILFLTDLAVFSLRSGAGAWYCSFWMPWLSMIYLGYFQSAFTFRGGTTYFLQGTFVRVLCDWCGNCYGYR